MNPNVILICGSTGAGKSTYARKWANEHKGLHFSIDEFMKQLFWMDSPKPVDFQWTIERVERCEKLIQSLAFAFVATGGAAVLDLGFSESKQRSKFYEWCKENRLTYQLHFLDIPKEVRWERVNSRNASLDHQAITVDAATFEWMENYFEAPTAQELAENGGLRLDLSQQV